MKRLLKCAPFFLLHPTSIERSLQAELARRSVPFTAQAADLGLPDLVLSNYKVVIFADGCYWHGCTAPSCKFFQTRGLHYMIGRRRSANEQREHDRKVTQYYQNNGFKVFRFWEHEIKKSAAQCVEQVIAFINQHSTTETDQPVLSPPQ